MGGVNVVTDGIAGGIEAAEAGVAELARRMLGSTLVTIQTGPEGKQVNRLYIEQGIDIDRGGNSVLFQNLPESGSLPQ